MPPAASTVQRGAFIALGAVGLSLGAAWAWSHRAKRIQADPSETEPDVCSDRDSNSACSTGVTKGPSPRRRTKRHKRAAGASPPDAEKHATPGAHVDAAAPASEGHADAEVCDADAAVGKLDACDAEAATGATAGGATAGGGLPAGDVAGDSTMPAVAESALLGREPAAPVQLEAQERSACANVAPAGDAWAGASAEAEWAENADASGAWISVERRQRRRRRPEQPEHAADETSTTPETVLAAAPPPTSPVERTPPHSPNATSEQPAPTPLDADDGGVGNAASAGVQLPPSADAAAADALVGEKATSSLGEREASKPAKAKRKKKPKPVIQFDADEGGSRSGDEQLPPLPWHTSRSPAQIEPQSEPEVLPDADPAAEAAAALVSDEGATVELAGVSAAARAADSEAWAQRAEEEAHSPPAQPPADGGWVEVKKRRGKRPAGGQDPRLSD